MEASSVPRVAPAGVAAFASPGLLRLLSDDRLVALIRDGNRNAFEAVYDRHYRAILSFCRHMLGCADEAEDAVQHTFLAAYNDLVSSRKPIRLRAWLFTIARNRCLSILRARRERTALEFEEQATDGVALQVERRQDLRDLVVDINHLPDDQRAALVLAEMGALSHGEIGSVIGVPKVKVKALIFQARESLLADRAAREADCREIREQLSTMRGAALRRATLRRHLRECQGCRDYRHELEGQRRRIAAILPVAPTFALRDAILGVTAGGGLAGAGAAGSGLLGASSVLKGLAGKALIAALLATVGTTGTILVVHDLRLQAPAVAHRHSLQATAGGFVGTTTAPLATGPTSISAPASAAPSQGIAVSGGRSGLGGAHATILDKALVHALTGQLTNLLSPVWPHEKAGPARGAVPHRATPRPAAPPVVAAPTPAASSPAATPSQPSPASPSGTAGGGSSGRSSGGSASGGPGPSGLSGQGAGAGSTAGSGSAAGGSGTTTGTPSGTGSGGSPTGGAAGAGSGPGPTPGPGPATTPGPTTGPGPGPMGGAASPATGPGPTSQAAPRPGPSSGDASGGGGGHDWGDHPGVDRRGPSGSRASGRYGKS